MVGRRVVSGTVFVFVLAFAWAWSGHAAATESTATTAAATTTPPETVGGPTERDPAWRASVVLGCGSGVDTRVVASFEASIEPGQSANLMLATHQSGGEALRPLTVGSEVAADAELRWNIQDVFLGPWPVDSVEDTCDTGAGQVADDRLPATGAGGLLVVALVGVGLAAAGLLVLGAGHRTARP